MEHRPRPVMWYATLVAALQAFLGVAGITDLVDTKVIAWLNVTLVVLVAIGGGLIVQSQTTPLSDPQARDGRTLVPSPPADVPAGTPDSALDATREDPPRRTLGGAW